MMLEGKSTFSSLVMHETFMLQFFRGGFDAYWSSGTVSLMAFTVEPENHFAVDRIEDYFL